MRFAPIALISLALASSASAAERSVAVGPFTKFTTVSVDTTLKVGPAPSLILTGPADQLLKVVVEQKNGALTLRPQRKAGALWGNDADISDVKATVTTARLSAVSVAGSGDVIVSGVNARRFTMEIGGSGSITANDAIADVFDGSIGGSGSLNLAGTCGKADFSIGGSGNVNAEKLLCKTLDVSIGGAGKVKAYASMASDVSVAGSGDVTIFGNPKKREKSVAGSGEVTYPQ